MKYVIDKATGKLVEKPDPNASIELLEPCIPPAIWQFYLEFLEELYCVFSGQKK